MKYYHCCLKLSCMHLKQNQAHLQKNMQKTCYISACLSSPFHAQQAACYIRGHLDGTGSHKTVPMLSNLLILYVKQTLPENVPMIADIDHFVNNNIEGNDNNNATDNENIAESFSLCTLVDKNGRLLKSTQIDNYIYHDHKLPFASMTLCIDSL